MNVIKPLSCFLAIVFSTSAAATVTLDVPDTIDLLVVNGGKPNTSGGFFASSKKVEMEDGQQQIVFRYHPYFTQGNDRVGVESDVVIAKFNAADQSISFDMPEFRNAADAERSIKSMEWTLRDQQGTAIEMKQDRLIKEGMQIGRDYKQETLEYNMTGGPAAITTQYVKPTSANGSTSDTTAEEMLHFWYGKADAQTKARFKQYVNQQ
ncbi:DUF2057 family protein [Vibrio fluvialis]|uniref:DUF2057 family protein n=1 Tax=Vibrio fluvialis TaxID=676 RepID=UPI001C9BDB23|nr:DUF2057 family protein [Vibrio fluvialis]HDM8033966.1 DUF2057 family protein [Vibrio fluvialis clinical-1]EKO3411451.1 DUF2057 family protein [Vibrio fluvialis]EKO3420012.1 DUF2057 family protein [Vibrio fluvialis]EKO3520226.1 DUF2057 family protein [Vibrio fluvialis]EKO3527104.1 DUF2057 family protein [Vibrio fluvialis]